MHLHGFISDISGSLDRRYWATPTTRKGTSSPGSTNADQCFAIEVVSGFVNVLFKIPTKPVNQAGTAVYTPESKGQVDMDIHTGVSFSRVKEPLGLIQIARSF